MPSLWSLGNAAFRQKIIDFSITKIAKKVLLFFLLNYNLSGKFALKKHSCGSKEQ